MKKNRTPLSVLALAILALAMAPQVSAQLAIGSMAPEINAGTWINTEGVSINDNDGKYTLVEFWLVYISFCKFEVEKAGRSGSNGK